MKYIIPTLIAVLTFFVIWFGVNIFLGPVEDKLPADYLTITEPVEVCYAEGVVVNCHPPVEVGGGK